MANSYVDYLDRSVRINDQILTLFVFQASDVSKRYSDSEPNGVALVKEWESQALIGVPGLITLDLTGYWESDNGKEFFRTLLRDVKKTLSEYGGVIPAERFNVRLKGTLIHFIDMKSDIVLQELKKLDELVK